MTERTNLTSFLTEDFGCNDRGWLYPPETYVSVMTPPLSPGEESGVTRNALASHYAYIFTVNPDDHATDELPWEPFAPNPMFTASFMDRAEVGYLIILDRAGRAISRLSIQPHVRTRTSVSSRSSFAA